MRRRAAWVPVANKVIGTWAPRRRDAEPLAALAEHARSLEKSDHHLDQGFTDDMTVLWQAFTTAEDLSPIGRLALRQDVVRRLAIRLRVAAQPGHLAQRPLRPVFVIGLPAPAPPCCTGYWPTLQASGHQCCLSCSTPGPLEQARACGRCARA
ncbi:hypothetical protein ACFWY5_53520 [Nonomuraea sp. NPDC059007]|uniref:hypothetical protein n=1 Tax=Nonomuraea sp. NPDC059007 TaxID=3346692 RepID=UPI003691EEBF